MTFDSTVFQQHPTQERPLADEPLLLCAPVREDRARETAS